MTGQACKIKIKYDDGAEEESKYPDKDIVLLYGGDNGGCSRVGKKGRAKRGEEFTPVREFEEKKSVSPSSAEDTKTSTEQKYNQVIKNVLVKDKVKVKFADLIWYKAEVLNVARDTRGKPVKLKIRYEDDGVEEVCDYPDKDLVLVDNLDEGGWRGVEETYKRKPGQPKVSPKSIRQTMMNKATS